MLTIPDYPQEVFPRRPLKTVICQVRFHDILRITSEEPAAFQTRVIAAFPKFVRSQSVGFAVVGGQVSPAASGTTWEFHTNDDAYVIGLTSGSMSLESRQYTNFEAFAKHLEIGLRAVVDVYAPPVLTRVGLRYVNEVIRLAPKEGRVDWRGWVNGDLVPRILLDPHIVAGVQGSGHLVTFKQPDGMVNVRYNLQRGEADGRSAEAFTLDMDYFAEEELAPENVMARVTSFNSWNYRFFRWAIGEKLLERMRDKDGKDDEGVILGAAAE